LPTLKIDVPEEVRRAALKEGLRLLVLMLAKENGLSVTGVGGDEDDTGSKWRSRSTLVHE
jgi:hypothetical protein